VKQFSHELALQFAEQAIPFNRWMGIRTLKWEPGDVTAMVPFKEDLIGDPFRPALHGGIIAALIDATGGAAVFTRLGPHDRASTVDLRIDYLRPGRPADLYCNAKVVRMGNRVVAVSATAYHEGKEDEPVAMGMGVYNLKRVEGDALPKGAKEAPEPREE
jgi:uncharacterized protein (TIGR00369 family)